MIKFPNWLGKCFCNTTINVYRDSYQQKIDGGINYGTKPVLNLIYEDICARIETQRPALNLGIDGNLFRNQYLLDVWRDDNTDKVYELIDEDIIYDKKSNRTYKVSLVNYDISDPNHLEVEILAYNDNRFYNFDKAI